VNRFIHDVSGPANRGDIRAFIQAARNFSCSVAGAIGTGKKSKLIQVSPQ
jgi:hypothetical protein